MSALLAALAMFLVFPKIINAQILINEFSPKGSPEWVEFFNENNSEINLEGYYFDDDDDFDSDTGNSKKIKLQGLFPSSSLCYLDMSYFLNDSGDIPTLFAPNGDIQDTYSYASSSAGLSYSRVPDGGDWQVNTIFSKTLNSCSSLPTPTPTEEPTSTPISTPTPTPTSTQTPTSTPTPTSIPTNTPTPKSSTSEVEDLPKPTSKVLSAATDSSPYKIFFQESTVSASASSQSASVKSKLGVNLTLVGLGLLTLSGSVLFFRNNPY